MVGGRAASYTIRRLRVTGQPDHDSVEDKIKVNNEMREIGWKL